MKSIGIKLCLLLGGSIFLIKLATAQGSQMLPAFTKLMVEDNIQVEVILANRYSLYIENGRPSLQLAQVREGTLSLNADNAGGTMVKVYTKSLEVLQLKDIARVETLDTLIGSSLSISLQNGSKVKLSVGVTNLSIEMQDGSECIVNGSAQTVNAKLQDLSRLSAIQLIIQDLLIETSDAAKASVFVKNNLTAEAKDLSKLTYAGNPQTQKISADDFAKVKNGEIVLDKRKEENGFISREPPVVIENGEPNIGDTTRLTFGKRRLMIIDDTKRAKEFKDKTINNKGKREMKSVWGGFELGLQSFTTPQFNFTMPAEYNFLTSKIDNSWFFGLNFPEYDLHIIQNKLAFTTGFGLQWSNIRFQGNDYLIPNIDSIASVSAGAGIDLTNNKLHTFDFTAPLLLKLATGNKKQADKGFHFAVGVIGHYVFTQRAIIVTETSSKGFNQKQILRDDFNINPFRLDATVRFGYNDVKLFVNYSLTPYFRDNEKNPDVRLFAAGITLIGF